MNSASILVVDDDQMIVHFFKMILEETGYLVEAALTGSEAIECAKARAIDLAILDYKLADMTGDVLAKKLKEINAKMIIVFVTGYSEAKDRIAGNDLAHHVVVKPIKDDELVAVVEHAFQDYSMIMNR